MVSTLLCYTFLVGFFTVELNFGDQYTNTLKLLAYESGNDLILVCHVTRWAPGRTKRQRGKCFEDKFV